jgi:hypothetical protein
MIAAKDTSSFSTADVSFATNRSSLPRMASISLSPALKIALFLENHLGSSNPQTLPTQPPASQITRIPPSSYKTETAPD